MKTVTAKIIKSNQTDRFISDAINYKGYLARKIKKGLGKVIDTVVWSNGFDDAGEDEVFETYVDFYTPFFNQTIVDENFNLEEFKEYAKDKDLQSFIGTEYEKTLIKWDLNKGGLLVVDAGYAKEKEKKDNAKLIFDLIKAETGFDFIHHKVRYVEDEDGKTPIFSYTLKHITGAEYGFTDTNRFDFGRCINPIYDISPEHGSGGLLYSSQVKVFVPETEIEFGGIINRWVDRNDGNVNGLTVKGYVYKDEEGRYYSMQNTGEMWWHSCCDKNNKYLGGWVPIRKVDALELIAYNIIEKYGNAFNGIRL
jgi:hypothetical protein